MNAKIEIVPFDGIWGSYSRLLDQGKIALPNRPLSALDLGCGPGYPLFVLYHDHGFSTLTGVDVLSETGVLVQEKRHLPIENRTPNQEMLWHCNSVYELYRLVMQPERSRVHKAPLQPLEFYQHFNFVWEQDLREYLHGLDADDTSVQGLSPGVVQNAAHLGAVSQNDVIILSNVLHFRPHREAKAMVRKAAAKLGNDGILLVRVYHEGSEKFKGRGFQASSRVEQNPRDPLQQPFRDDRNPRDPLQQTQTEYRKDRESYWTYNKDLFLDLFSQMEILAFEGIRNSEVPGYKFLTVAARKG